MSHSQTSFSSKDLATMSLDYDETTAIVTLTRAEAVNAMNAQFFVDFSEILDDLENDGNPSRALLIRSNGKGFCSGADLKGQLGTMPPNLADLLRKNYHPFILRLKNLKMPTIVALNGAVAGAGMSFVCACDLIIAEREAYFLQAFINIALVPDAGSTYFLPRLIGRARATSLMMLGERLPAEQALEYGLITSLVETDELSSESLALAKKMASKPTQSLYAIRKLLDASEHNSLEQQLESEAIAQQNAGLSDDFMEGVSSFLEKRSPVFKGK